MDPTTMTLDEIRDWAARRQGWDAYVASNGITVWHRGGFGKADDPYQQSGSSHPIPPTLDAIAGLMPSGWKTFRVWKGQAGEWRAYVRRGTGDDWDRVTTIDTGNELLDRARLAMLATLAEDKATKQEDDDGN
jgi:hypothetical protein